MVIGNDSATEANIIIKEDCALPGCDAENWFIEFDQPLIAPKAQESPRNWGRFVADFDLYLIVVIRRRTGDPIQVAYHKRPLAEAFTWANYQGILRFIFVQYVQRDLTGNAQTFALTDRVKWQPLMLSQRLSILGKNWAGECGLLAVLG